MNRRKRIRRMLILSFKTAGADKFLSAYLVIFFLLAIPIWIWEPGISTYGDSLWYCFIAATSIGFGDFTAVTVVGRILTVILSVYSIAVIAVSTAAITSFSLDYARLRADDSAQAFFDDLTHLRDLSKDELEAISEKVRKFQSRRKK